MDMISSVPKTSLIFLVAAAAMVMCHVTASGNSDDKVSLTNGRDTITWERLNLAPSSRKRHASEGYNIRCVMTRGVAPQRPPKVMIRSEAEFREDTRQCVAHERRRRQVMAGTLWCGNGDNAGSYEELGYFSEVDKCCRSHDHCPRYVVASETEYGVTNDTPYTWSDCECDDDFRQCLHAINSYMSNFVGSIFFDAVTTSMCVQFDENDPTQATAVPKGSYESKEEEASWWNIFG